MSGKRVRDYLRTHVLGMTAIFIALTGTAVAANSVPNPTASPSAVTNAKFKKLKKRVAALEATLNGPVTGDLNGTFPNLQIRPNAVTETELAGNAVTTAKIADNAVANAKMADNAIGALEIVDGSVGQAEVGNDAIGAGELKPVSDSTPGFTSIASGGSDRLNANCDANEQALSFGGTWDTTDLDDTSMTEAFLLTGGNTGYTVRAANNDTVAHGFAPRVTCLDQ